MRRYELSDFEWGIIEPHHPNKVHGVPRVDDRKVLNGILWRFRTGSPWADIPERYGPSTTCYNRFVRWRKAGVWDRLLAMVSKAFDGEIIMIDSSCIRVQGQPFGRCWAAIFGHGRADRELSGGRVCRLCQPLRPHADRPAALSAQGMGRRPGTPGQGEGARGGGVRHQAGDGA